MPKVEEFFNNLFSGGKTHAEGATTTASAAPAGAGATTGSTGGGDNPATYNSNL
ncbi:MAG: hypothetical protein M3Q06_00575 [Bacteroidota bacterium]|nr:hypothetical protein [Bacteroidota bacterium]